MGICKKSAALLLALICAILCLAPDGVFAAEDEKARDVMDRIDALEEITETAELGEELAAIRWKYDNLSETLPVGDPAKGQVTEEYVRKLEQAEKEYAERVSEFPTSAVREDSALNWGSFLGNRSLPGVTDSKTPRGAEEMERKWSFNISAGFSDWAATPGTPVIVGDYTYCYIGKKLRKFRTSDGVQVACADAEGEALFFIHPVYGDGKIFLPRSSGSGIFLIAYDADTLERLFVTENVSGYQPEGQTAYCDGYVYFSTYGEEGVFACFPTQDGEKTTGDEVVPAAWIYRASVRASDTFGAFMGPAFADGNVIFATGGSQRAGLSSRIVVADAKTGQIRQTLELPNLEYVSSTLVYSEEYRRIFIAATNGSEGLVLRSYEIKEGRIDVDSLRLFVSSVKNGGTQSTPVIYNGRLYLGGGGRTMGSEEPFRVLDAETLEEIYTVDGLKTKGSVCLTTAYATEENGQEVFLYVIPYAPERKTGGSAQDPGDYECSELWILRDREGQTEPSYEIVKNVGDAEYCSQSVAADKNGNLVFYNDSKGLFCYGPTGGGEFTAADVVRQIARLPEPEELSYYNEFELKRIAERYENLGPEEKEAVTNYEKLERILRSDESDVVEMLNRAWKELDPAAITADDYARLSEWKRRYDALSEPSKAFVTEYPNFLAALTRAEELRLEQQTLAVTEAIDLLPEEEELTSAHSAQVEAARLRYDALPLAAKAQVQNYFRLLSAERRLQEISQRMREAEEKILATLTGKISEEKIPAILAVDALLEDLSDEDVSQITAVEQYLSPAKAELANLTMEKYLLTADGEAAEIAAHQAKRASEYFCRVQYFIEGVSDADRKYLKYSEQRETIRRRLEELGETTRGTPSWQDVPEGTAPQGQTVWIVFGVSLAVVFSAGTIFAVTRRKRRKKERNEQTSRA